MWIYTVRRTHNYEEDIQVIGDLLPYLLAEPPSSLLVVARRTIPQIRESSSAPAARGTLTRFRKDVE